MRLSTILGRFGEVVEEGDGYVATCPAHADSHASLRVAISSDTGSILIKCRAGCETRAVLDAVGLSFGDLFTPDVDVRVRVATAGSGEVPLEDQAQMMAYLASCAKRIYDPLVAEYLQRRFGVSVELAERLGLGFDPGGGVESFHLLGAVHHQVPRLVVPFRDVGGVPRGFQARALPYHKVRWSGPTNPPDGGSWTKIGFFPSGSGMDYVVVCEGPGDALTSCAAGVDAVGIRGASLGPNAAELLAGSMEGRRLILAGDADRAGREMNEKLAERLTGLGFEVRILDIPEPFGDLSEWQESSSSFVADFQAAVSRARLFTIEDPEPIEFDALPQSHVEVAKLIVDRFGGRLVNIIGLGFHLFEGGVWTEDKLAKVRLEIFAYGDEVAAALDAFLEEYPQWERETLPENERKRLKFHEGSLSKHLAFIRRTQEIDRIEKEVGVMVRKGNEEFDRHTDLLTVRNGVVDLRSGVLLPHDPALLLTQKVDVDYVADAECPRWEAFLGEVFPGAPDMPAFMRRLVGYGITGRTTEQCFAVLWGRGANGKSVFTETVSDVFSGISRTTPFETFEEKRGGGIPNDVAALRGARLVFASEGERGKPMAESILKRLTGQDKISARFMRQEFFEFRPSFLLFMASNHKPYFRSADEGLWRRVKMVPWRRFFEPEERDPYLHQKMVAEESEGILAWAVRGAVEWFQSGLREPGTVVDATASYRDSQDPLASFYPHGPVGPSEGGEVKAQDIWEEYLAWADDEMLPMKERWGRNTFYAGLEERGIPLVRKSGGRVFLGIEIKKEENR